MIIECVPNFSAGRDLDTVNAIAQAIAAVEGVAILDQTSDQDHDRSVITFAGSSDAVREAAIRAVEVAAQRIDLTKQKGVHPRIGAADVIPFVPIKDATMEDCVRIAHATGQEIWQRTKVPVYFYEAAALKPERTNLADVRQGRFSPDIGGPALHPTAGATIVGARKFLIAYNINLATNDLDLAKRIARKIRASNGGFPAVKALGLALESRNIVQVSMNLTDYEQTGIDQVYEAVASEAEVLGSELIGLIPKAALPTLNVKWENFNDTMILENRLRTVGYEP